MKDLSRLMGDISTVLVVLEVPVVFAVVNLINRKFEHVLGDILPGQILNCSVELIAA